MKRNVTLGIIIILIGVIWLLNNLNLFPFSIVQVTLHSLGKLWPLLLIGLGLNILLRNNSSLKIIVWVLIFSVILAYGVLAGNSPNSYEYSSPKYDYKGKYSEEHSYSLALEPGTEKGRLKIDFGAGKFKVGSATNNLLEVKSNVPDLKYGYSYNKDEKKATIDFNRHDYSLFGEHENLYCNLELNRELTWEINMDLGAAKGNLDFREMNIRKMDLDMGAADLDLYIGGKNKITEVTINAGASNIDIYVPEKAGLKIILDSALSKTNISRLNLVKEDKYYVSRNFEDAQQKIYFYIDMGVGNLDFHPR